MKITGVGGPLTNLGLLEVWGVQKGSVIIDIPYIDAVAGFQVGRLRRGPTAPKVIFQRKIVGLGGVIENGEGDGIAFNAGIDVTGGQILNYGKMEVVGGLNLSGGTVTSHGNGTDPASLTADALTQSGGGLVVDGGPSAMTVSGDYLFTGGSATLGPSPYQFPNGLFFGHLEVAAPLFVLAGGLTAPDGVHVAAGGGFQLSGYETVGLFLDTTITVDGLLDIPTAATRPATWSTAGSSTSA